MGRCKACNKTMTDAEMVRKDVMTGDYAELCGGCMIESDEAYLNDLLDDEEYFNLEVES